MVTDHIYKLIFENAREGLLLTDNRGIIELVNPRILEIFKYENNEELLGKPIEILIPRELRRKHVQHRIKYYQNPDKFANNNFRPLVGSCKDDSQVYVDVSLSYFHNQDGEIKVLSFVNDITGVIQMEEALQKEKELNELKSRFVSMVSHEIRTPLTSIFTSATLISKYTQSAQQPNREKHIERIKRSVNHLTALLEDVLSLQKIEEDINPVSIELLHFPDIIDEVLNDYFYDTNLKERIEYSHHGKSIFHTDKNTLCITVKNLLDNAIKYAPAPSPIFLTTRVDENGLSLVVRDEGMGIPQEEQAVIFDRFFRASNAVNIGGTGLGLSIVQGMLRKIGGSIFVESKPDEFSEFKVHLPPKSIV